MKTIPKFGLAFLALVCAGANAAAVEYDTPGAYIVVIRPMDQWNSDETSAKKLDASFFADETILGYYDDESKAAVNIKSDNGLAPEIRESYPNVKFIGSLGGAGMFVGKPASLTPAEASAFTGVQSRLYESNIYNQGNPKSLPDRINAGQIWSNVLTLATIGIAGKFGGGMAAATSVTLANQVGNIPVSAQKFIIAAKPAKIDFSKYQSIEVRMTAYGMKRFGQVIIAYKHPKTKQAEDAAMLIAVASTGGLDTTKEATMASRSADLADRQAIWDKCVADGKCKNEE